MPELHLDAHAKIKLDEHGEIIISMDASEEVGSQSSKRLAAAVLGMDHIPGQPVNPSTMCPTSFGGEGGTMVVSPRLSSILMELGPEYTSMHPGTSLAYALHILAMLKAMGNSLSLSDYTDEGLPK